MALHLPRPRTTKPAQQAVGLDGLKVSVANAATSGVEKSKQVKSGGLAGLTSKVSVTQLRKELGNEGLRQAAIDAGRTPHPRAHCAGGRSRAASRMPIFSSVPSGVRRSNDWVVSMPWRR